MDKPTLLVTVLRSLRRTPIRSALTALGVIVGVASVVTTSSIGAGAEARIREVLALPESRTVHLVATVPPTQRLRFGAILPAAERLREEDYRAIQSDLPVISAASIRILVPKVRVEANGQNSEALLEGIDVGGFTTIPRRLLEGALFSALDVTRVASVCVVSQSLAKELYPDKKVHGERIRINNSPFVITGVVDDVLTPSVSGRPGDMRVYMPFTSLLRRIDSNAQIAINAQAEEIEGVTRLQQDLSDLMEQRRSGRKASFITSAALDSIKSHADGSLAVTRLLAAVGAVSLIVGGIGIMNIMLVSVKERTREIGIRMAIGTRPGHILSQFLAEAVSLSLIGSVAGIAIGSATSWAVTSLNGWHTSVTLASVFGGVLCGMGVGIFFGYHPARRAAMLNPVEALRMEG